MVGFFEAEFLGLDPQAVADLNASLPELDRILSIAQAEWPKIAPHVPALLRVAREIIAKQRSLP